MQPDDWARVRPDGLRAAHFVLTIGCPDPTVYPGQPALCTHGAGEALAVIETGDDPERSIPREVLSAMLRDVADYFQGLPRSSGQGRDFGAALDAWTQARRAGRN